MITIPVPCRYDMPFFHDIHYQDHLQLSDHRIIGMQEDEVLYADDTVCMTENENATNRLLRAIEIEGANYGLRLNKKKCEYLHFGEARPVYFNDGTKVPQKHEVKYLGCNLNDKGDPEMEINKRRKECVIMLNKLHVFFYNTDNTVARKIRMFDAILRAKMMYGLETLQ